MREKYFPAKGDPIICRPMHRWQLPQGGIDAAKRREMLRLAEETGIASAQLIYELPDWLRYDLPDDLMARERPFSRAETKMVCHAVYRPRKRN